jgi:hypothetical protein
MTNDRPEWLPAEWSLLKTIWEAFQCFLCGLIMLALAYWGWLPDVMIWLHGGPRNVVAPIGFIAYGALAGVYFLLVFGVMRYLVGRRRRKAAIVAASIEVMTVTRRVER